jgi:hypothetical protein
VNSWWEGSATQKQEGGLVVGKQLDSLDSSNESIERISRNEFISNAWHSFYTKHKWNSFMNRESNATPGWHVIIV